MYVNFENFEKVCKVWVFESRNPVFGSKSLEKFGNVRKSSETGFSECSEILEIVLFQNFQKLRKNDVISNFGNRVKLVPT